MSAPVHVGRDGWLFLVAGSNDVLAQYRPGAFPPALLAAWRQLLELRVRLARRLGARYLNVPVPEKLTVYAAHLDGLSVDPALSPAGCLRRALRFSPAARANLDLAGLFRAHRDGPPLYLKTDSHWTPYGCDLAYRAICRRIGVRPRTDFGLARHRRAGRFVGDLGNKFDPHRSEMAEGWDYPRGAERFYADARVIEAEARGHLFWAGGTGTHVAYRSAGPGVNRRRVLLMGDSYASHTWQPWAGALTPMLAETVSELHAIWSAGIDWDYVEQVRPDAIVTQIAERFIVHPRFVETETRAILDRMGRRAPR